VRELRRKVNVSISRTLIKKLWVERCGARGRYCELNEVGWGKNVQYLRSTSLYKMLLVIFKILSLHNTSYSRNGGGGMCKFVIIISSCIYLHTVHKIGTYGKVCVETV
jgi:hypothetical protein